MNKKLTALFLLLALGIIVNAQLPSGVTFPNYQLSTTQTQAINVLPTSWSNVGRSSNDIENFDANYQNYASLPYVFSPSTQGWSSQTALITSLYTTEAGATGNPDIESYRNTISGLTIGTTYTYSIEAAYNNLGPVSGAPQGRVPYLEVTFGGVSGGVYQLTSTATVYEFTFTATSTSVEVIINDNITNDPEYTGGSSPANYETNPQVMVLAGSGKFVEDSCPAGENAPSLNVVANFSSNTYTIPCGAQVADLTALTASNKPAAPVIMTFHSATPATDLNKVAPVTGVGPGTYYVAFFDPADKCYSDATQQITVVKESPCVTDCSTALPVSACSSNPAANATSDCATLGNADRIMFFDWQGSMQDGQSSTINSNGVTYTATISNYEHITNSGTPQPLDAADLNSELWQGTKMKYMYTDGSSAKNEGWYLAGNEDGLHRWTVTVIATHNATGTTFPVNVLAFDMESTNQPQDERVLLQSMDGGNWIKLEDYQPSCAGTTNFGLGNGGQGILSGVGTTTITYLDTENVGGNSYWYSEGATTINMEIETASSRQGIGMALLLDCDTDGNGIPDKYESIISGTVKDESGTPIQGAILELFDENEVSLGTKATGADGSYTFENVPAGTGYKVVETDASGYESVSDTDGANDNTVENIQVNYGYESCQPQFVDKLNICTLAASSGQPEVTRIGVSTLDRNVEDWMPEDIGGYIALESDTKPFVVTRMANPATSINTPVEGMIVWDTDDYCLKLYDGTQWKCMTQGCNQ